MDSKVLRPMTMTCPVVVCLNHRKSSGRCHGIRLPAPITRLSDIAAMAWKRFTQRMLSHRSLLVKAAQPPNRLTGLIPFPRPGNFSPLTPPPCC